MVGEEVAMWGSGDADVFLDALKAVKRQQKAVERALAHRRKGK
jgi:hypothetical protein